MGTIIAMDDDSFKTELLNRLERIQSLLSYLCATAKAAEERSKAGTRMTQANGLAHDEDEPTEADRATILEEMQESYREAVQKWKATKSNGD